MTLRVSVCVYTAPKTTSCRTEGYFDHWAFYVILRCSPSVLFVADVTAVFHNEPPQINNAKKAVMCGEFASY